MPGCTSSCWSTLSFQTCNALTTPPAMLYFSRIMLQPILHQLLLNGLSSTAFRSTNTPLFAGSQSHSTCLGSPQSTASQTVSRYRALRARLMEVLPKVWGSLHEQLFDNLYRRMPDGVSAATDSKVLSMYFYSIPSLTVPT